MSRWRRRAEKTVREEAKLTPEEDEDIDIRQRYIP
jgi:hypothetical protein